MKNLVVSHFSYTINFMFIFIAGQRKPSVSKCDDSFVTPHKSRKSKKPAVTFSSDEEEDEEGE